MWSCLFCFQKQSPILTALAPFLSVQEFLDHPDLELCCVFLSEHFSFPPSVPVSRGIPLDASGFPADAEYRNQISAECLQRPVWKIWNVTENSLAFEFVRILDPPSVLISRGILPAISGFPANTEYRMQNVYKDQYGEFGMLHACYGFVVTL